MPTSLSGRVMPSKILTESSQLFVEEILSPMLPRTCVACAWNRRSRGRCAVRCITATTIFMLIAFRRGSCRSASLMLGAPCAARSAASPSAIRSPSLSSLTGLQCTALLSSCEYVRCTYWGPVLLCLVGARGGGLRNTLSTVDSRRLRLSGLQCRVFVQSCVFMSPPLGLPAPIRV